MASGGPAVPPPGEMEAIANGDSVFRQGVLKGRGYIVTGGGTGLGFAIAKELALLGANVVIAARRLELLEEAAATINNLVAQQEGAKGGKGLAEFFSWNMGWKVAAVKCNVRSEEDVTSLVDAALEHMGRIDGLVNNAGGQFVSPVEDISARGFAAVLETNLKSVFMLSKQVYLKWMGQHGGSIVNIILANHNGFPMMAHSGASRAGVENLSRSMAIEWVGSGVRVNCVAPGIIFTESGFANYGPMADTFLQNLLPAIPAKRCGTAEEVSSAVVFLLGPSSVYVTGQTLNVDGGMGQSYMPLRPSADSANLLPTYGPLPPKAKL